MGDYVEIEGRQLDLQKIEIYENADYLTAQNIWSNFFSHQTLPKMKRFHKNEFYRILTIYKDIFSENS